jgi:hypothetical protein
MSRRYEELTTPEAVVAAFEAGRRVERTANQGRNWLPTAQALERDTAGYIRIGWRYRALIEEPEASAYRVESSNSGCPICGEPEVEANTPRTTYGCGSSDYDQRPGTFVQRCGTQPAPSDVEALAARIASYAEAEDISPRERDDLREAARRLRPQVDASDADIDAWAERHDLAHAIRGTDARAAFEDAQTWHLTYAMNTKDGR